MSNAAIEARLDKLLERVSGQSHQTPVVDPNREIARMVKRTEVATTLQKQNVVKFIVIGVVIILLLVGIIYFVAKTKYGKGIRDMLGEYLPIVDKKRKIQDVSQTSQASTKVLVAEDVDLRSRPLMAPRPPPQPRFANQPQDVSAPITVRVPPIKPKDENEHLDPGAVPFRRRPTPQAPLDVRPSAQRDEPPPQQRGPSPPMDDKGPDPPPELVDASLYQND